jgi:hypothetical protein
MPGKGKLVEREYSPSERKAILDGAKALHLSEKEVFADIGDKTFDVYVNRVAYWSNVPAAFGSTGALIFPQISTILSNPTPPANPFPRPS